jgi:hypothetical protein
MPSIKEIQSKLAAFDRAARGSHGSDAYKSAWKRIFKQDLSNASAKSFERYYKKMRSKARSTRRQRRQQGGGTDSTPAPVSYTMTPGLYVEQYGKFPIAVDTDPSSLKELDVYFGDSLPRSPAGYWPTVPANMGSNKVGGARRRRGTRRGRRAHRRHRTRRATQRGGNLLDSLAMRPVPFIATPYPNMIQGLSNAWAGATTPVPAPASPVSHTWELRGSQGQAINPGLVSNIDSSFQRLASPAPWQTSN